MLRPGWKSRSYSYRPERDEFTVKQERRSRSFPSPFLAGSRVGARSPWEDVRYEKFPAMASNRRGDSCGGRCFKRAAVRARRRRRKYFELARLSTASSGIEAAIVATHRATVLRPSPQVAAPALTCSAQSRAEIRVTGIEPSCHQLPCAECHLGSTATLALQSRSMPSRRICAKTWSSQPPWTMVRWILSGSSPGWLTPLSTVNRAT